MVQQYPPTGTEYLDQRLQYPPLKIEDLKKRQQEHENHGKT